MKILRDINFSRCNLSFDKELTRQLADYHLACGLGVSYTDTVKELIRSALAATDAQDYASRMKAFDVTRKWIERRIVFMLGEIRDEMKAALHGDYDINSYLEQHGGE